MGWGFRVTCPDCRRDWEGTETRYRFGPWSRLEYPAVADGFRSWFCPRCYVRLDLPRTIERNVWRRWYATFLAGPDAEFAFLRDVAATLDAALSRGPYYTPLPVDLEPIDCPGCHQRFEESVASAPDRLVCPHCHGRGTVLDGFESHCQMPRDHGFS